jgi:Fic family protein
MPSETLSEQQRIAADGDENGVCHRRRGKAAHNEPKRRAYADDHTADKGDLRFRQRLTDYSSLAIEGNTLSLDEVADVADGKLVAGKQAEIKEVKNAFEAYDKIVAFDPYNVKDFLKAHQLMTDGIVKEAGKFRSDDVGVRWRCSGTRGRAPAVCPGIDKRLVRMGEKARTASNSEKRRGLLGD